MPLNRMLSSRALLALCTAGATACGLGLTDSGDRHSRVVLSVRSLLGEVLGGDFVTVADTARLTIASGDTQQTLTQLLGQGDDETTFDVTVDPGPATFSIAVISSNGSPLYQGQTNTTIEEDGFTVAITPQAVNAVMVVAPRRPQFVIEDVQFGNGFIRTFTAALTVRNPGSSALNWRVDSLVTLPPGVTIICRTPIFDGNNCLQTQTLASALSAPAFVQFRTPAGTAAPPTSGIRFVSNVGTATVLTVP
jgi:hypothetical protein